MVDLSSDWLILVWPLVTLLTWMAIAEFLARLLSGRSSTARQDDLAAREMSAFRQFARGEIDEDEYRRRATEGPAESGRSQHRASVISFPGRVRAVPEKPPGPAGASPPGGAGARGTAPREPTKRRRHGPHSVRGQITLLATVVTALTLFAAGVGTYLVAQAGVTRWRGDLGRAAVAATGTEPGTTHVRLPPPPHDVGRAALAAPGRHIPVVPLAGHGRTGVAAVRPPWDNHGSDIRTRESRAGDLPRYAAGPAAAFGVVAGARLPFRGPSWPGSLDLIMTFGIAELIALAGWATWKVTGRLLHPVEAVRAELALIDFTDLPARVSEPRNALEITRLCQTINNALGRLHTAKEELKETAFRQRQFASDVSHELRNPIAGLRAHLEEAQQDPGHALLPDLLGTTLDQVERLQEITDDLLCLARVRGCTPAERRRFDLAALVQDEIAHRADRLPVRLHLSHGATVVAVPSQISRLLANLLDNAQRHSTHLVCVEVHATHDTVELAVGDDGPGIPVADRERVFQRFTRLEDARRLDHNGTGLGLAIARDIAHAHSGTLNVEESATGGACFILRLPRVPPRGMGPA
ncbi:hypothetical protein Pth03_04950 [Planotetraspora thailandica]|uniref:histidine kinase n=1 Tax=Planotetraspora thailandica TaxID=487172 RepID=A0A8J3UWH5_9ACTN|nr:HAMP domain-containing sensor histidine kinase [Planotetraspora thailandica]GII52106.1 hypothetical protein Pth03_04950 [Planotetraspora thailandica]